MIPEDRIRRILAGDTSAKIDEAYKVEARAKDLSTERLSQGNKEAHRGLHEAYVKSLNTISAKLDTVNRADASANSSDFRSLKIDEVYNHNGGYLHDLFFENISDLKSSITVDSLAFMRLERDFGKFDDWQRDFIACSLASRCGWVVTGYSLYLGRYINVVIDLHATNVPVGFIPVVVIDVWQHSYYRDYLSDVKSYVIAMMKELNWTTISERFKRVDAMLQSVKGGEVKNG
jgi:Fe-Mn family superoxide dismutase